jgi:hypothetical protein
MTEEQFKGAFEALIQAGYYFCFSMNEDTEYKLRLTEKQKKVLSMLAGRLVEALENECVIIPEEAPENGNT